MSNTPSSAGKQGNTLGLTLLALLTAISALGPLAMNGVLPAASAIMDEYQATYGTAQLVLTVFLLAVVFAQIVIGQAADRWGRRPVMLFCLMMFTVGSLLCAIAPSIETLLAARCVQGAGAAACLVLPRTIVRDIYSRDEAASVIGYMTTAMMIAPLFGPAMGGWITAHLNWRFMYVGLTVLGLLLSIYASMAQRETLRKQQQDTERASNSRSAGPGALLQEPFFVYIMLLMAGSVGVYYSFLAGAPGVAMQSRGMSPSAYGIWFAMVGAGYLTGNFIAGRYSARLGSMRMISLGLFPLALALVLFWALSGVTHPIGLFLPMQLCALSNGMSLPNLMSVIMSVRPSLSATAMGLAGTVQIGFGVLLTMAVGYLQPWDDRWLFLLISVCIVLAMVSARQAFRLTASTA